MKRYWLVAAFLLLVGISCIDLPANEPTPIVATAVPPTQAIPTLISPITLTPSPSHLVTVSPTPPPDTGWELLHPGLERRVIRLLDENARLQDRLYILRIEPDLYQFAIAYRPGQPQSLADWQVETGALVVVNGGFFTEEFIATGRIVIEGVGSGLSYEGFGGMVAIGSEFVEVRSLVERPYDPNEPLQFALQAFPLLVKPGGIIGFTDEDEQRARRTVIGVDENGRILLILTTQIHFTLAQLSQYLVTSDLQLDVALNLDGGPSTSLRLTDPAEEIPAFLRLPTVITIHPR